MKKSAKKPVIRFSGFTNEWEQVKLKTLADFLRGNGLNWDAISQNGKQDCILYGHLYTDYGMIIDKVLYRTNEKLKNPFFSKFGDVLIPGSGPTLNGLARATSIEKDDVLIGGDVNIIRPRKSINGSYLSLCLNSCRNKLIQIIKGSIVRHIHNSDIKEIKVHVSIHEKEQALLVSFFKNIDNLLALHQRKCERLQNIKKAILEKMFPKNNADKPQIRFKGYTYAWERQSVKELCSITTGKSNTQDQDSNGKYPFYIRSEIIAKSNKFLYDCEAVITIGDGNIGRVFHYVNGKFDLHQRCYKMADFNTVTGKYFYYFFSTKFYNRAMRMTAKATVDSVRLDMIADMEIAYPKEVTEQNKISLFLDKFEDLLAFHQRKCQKLQNIKEAILEKMFC